MSDPAQIIRFSFPHKTASMFALGAIRSLAAANDLPMFGAHMHPENQQKVIPWMQVAGSGDIALLGPGRRYSYWQPLRDAFEATGARLLNVCQIRDPLDIIVSQYFSHGWVHPDDNWSAETCALRNRLQAGQVSVMDYALIELEGGAQFGGAARPEKLRELTSTPAYETRLLLRYEDFYSDYDAWVGRIAAFLPDHLAVSAPLLALRPDYSRTVTLEEDRFEPDPLAYVARHGIRKGRHVRTARPGDHRHFLTAAEIADLRPRIRSACPGLPEVATDG